MFSDRSATPQVVDESNAIFNVIPVTIGVASSFSGMPPLVLSLTAAIDDVDEVNFTIDDIPFG
jgi:hypothetical protein